MRYVIEISFDNWGNDTWSIEVDGPVNINIGEIFCTNVIWEGISEFEHIGYFKIKDKINYLFSKNYYKIGILLCSSSSKLLY